MYKTGDVIATDFTTTNPSTGAAANADSLPTGKLVINGSDSATVTVTNKATGVYSASVTLPTVVDGDVLQIRIEATVNSVAAKGIVWQGVGVDKHVGDLKDFDPAADTVAHVTLVDTCTTNTDMRGTDNASTFDPAADTVAHVSLVDTCTTNTDMRGTDNASTFDPDNDIVAHVALVDTCTTNTDMRGTDNASTFDPAIDTVAHVTLVDTCTTNTDMRGTDNAYTGTPPTANEIADQVLDEAISGHNTAGTVGEKLNKIIEKGTSYRYTQDSVSAANKTADVTIDDIP